MEELIFKGKEESFRIRKSFIELKDRELKDREVKIKRDIKLIVSLFKINTPIQTVYGRGKKLSKPKTQNIRNLYISKKKKKRN